MPFVSLDHAIRARLEAGTRDPLAPRRKLNVNVADAAFLAPTTAQHTRDQAKAKEPIKLFVTMPSGVSQRVPVFSPAASREAWANVWPAIEYDLVDLAFNTERYHFKDDICSALPQSTLSLLRGTSNAVSEGAGIIQRRPHPEPWDIVYQFQTWSKDETESMLLFKRLMEVFPPRTEIEVLLRDGTTEVWDMLWDRYNNADSNAPTLDGGKQREWSNIIRWRIEGFADNTLATELQATIRQRRMEYAGVGDPDKVLFTQVLDREA